MLRLITLDVFISVLDIFFLILLLLIINFYTQSARPAYIGSFHVGILNRQPVLLIGLFSLFFAIKNWLAFKVAKMQFYFTYKIASRLSKENLSSYLNGSYSDFINIDSSVHIRSINYDPVDFVHYVLRGSQQVLSQCILIVITLVPILIFKPILFSLLLLILVPPVLLLSILMKKKSDSVRLSIKTIHGKVFQYLKEAISGFVESSVYGGKEFFVSRFADVHSKQCNNLSQQQIMQSLPSRIIEVFAIMGLFFLVVINFYVNGNAVSILTIGAFMAAAYKIIPGIVRILNSVGQIKAYSFTVANLSSIKAPEPVALENNQVSTIEFQNLFFDYDTTKLLDDLSFSIKKGDIVGIAGGSGKGKTTILNLMLGYLTPRSGCILINGEMKESALKQFLTRISYVKQQPFFIHDSIAHNISLSEKYDEEKLNNAMTSAGVISLLNLHREGAHTTIAENGSNLSGGQRQRIAFARALYKNSDLFLLDEPFSELDSESESCLLQHLQSLAQKGKMIVLITHNKESLSFCNKIIDLDTK